MNERSTALLQLAAGQLAAIVGMLHVWIGLRHWSLYLSAGTALPPDIRVPLWTISGLALLVGVAIVALEERTTPLVYLGGILLGLVYIVGYYAWHLGGHRSFYLGGDPELHGVGPIEFLLDHTVAGPVEFAALATEVALVVALGVLLYDAMQTDGTETDTES